MGLKSVFNHMFRHYFIQNVRCIVRGVIAAYECVPMQSRVNLVLNGPSLSRSIDYILHQQAQSIVVNHFADSSYFELLRPEFYVIQDSYFWRSDVLSVYKKKREETYGNLSEKTTWPLTVFLPSFADIEFVKKKIDNSFVKVVQYNGGYLLGREKVFRSYVKRRNWLFYFWRKNVCAPPPENVLVGASYVAYLGGAKDISVYGADMSFFKGIEVSQDDNSVGVWFEHFYGREFQSHYKDKEGREPTTMSHELRKWSKVFWVFEVLEMFYSESGVVVKNKSAASYIDSFRRE